MQGSNYRSFAYVRQLEASVLAEIAIANHKKRIAEKKKKPKRRVNGVVTDWNNVKSMSGIRLESYSEKNGQTSDPLKAESTGGTFAGDNLSKHSTSTLTWTASMEIQRQDNKPLARKVLSKASTKYNVVMQLMEMKVAFWVWKE